MSLQQGESEERDAGRRGTARGSVLMLLEKTVPTAFPHLFRLE